MSKVNSPNTISPKTGLMPSVKTFRSVAFYRRSMRLGKFDRDLFISTTFWKGDGAVRRIRLIEQLPPTPTGELHFALTTPSEDSTKVGDNDDGRTARLPGPREEELRFWEEE